MPPSVLAQGRRPRPLISGSCAAHRGHLCSVIVNHPRPLIIYQRREVERICCVLHLCVAPAASTCTQWERSRHADGVAGDADVTDLASAVHFDPRVVLLSHLEHSSLRAGCSCAHTPLVACTGSMTITPSRTNPSRMTENSFAFVVPDVGEEASRERE